MKHRVSSGLRLAALCCAILLLFTACAANAGIDAPDAAPRDEAFPAEAGSVKSDEAAPGFAFDAVGKGDSDLPAAEPGSAEGDPGGDTPISPTPGEESALEGQPPAGLVLTAAEWNDNDNWPFFTNLVSAGTISFPSFGIDPRNRIVVTVQTDAGQPVPDAAVSLTDQDGAVLFTARSGKDGRAFLFFAQGQTPAAAVCGEASAPLQIRYSGAAQGKEVFRQAEEVTLTIQPHEPAPQGMQIMFIVDTTGSMGDELAYLQKDFSAIAGRVAAQSVSYCACFYRDEGDEYVTRVGRFTSDVQAVQARIAAEFADGGGDIPEAVSQILTQTLTDFDGWEEDCVKLAFLIFDAPPHQGTDAELIAAVRAAAEQGIRLIPVVASNADRDTELFGRAIAICTGGTYVFLTDDSGVGESHLEPIVGDYQVKLLQDLIVEIIERYQP